ncbi:MAG: P27 family phage terminase small subunit [Lachnospiraceae bacterium]|jgi:hypothetical protein|nr:P27 family phage terminase small subunit [Lachnospiraceae bacterium]
MGKSKLEQSLIRQLQEKGADVAHFRSLIRDYIWMNSQVQAMKRSIRKEGRTYQAVSAAGKAYEKENPAVKNLILYSRQMIAILREMGLTTENAVSEEDDEL